MDTLKCLLWILVGIQSIFSQGTAFGNELIKDCRKDDGTTENTYDPSKGELCCNGQVVTQRYGYEVTCCDGEFRRAGQHEECCGGTQMYNTDLSVCCSGNVYDGDSGVCCSGTWANGSTHTCCDGISRLGVGQCCGTDKVNDPKTHLCCTHSSNSSLVPFDIQTIESEQQDHFRCCGSKFNSYNRLDQVCCGDETFDKSPFHECCSGDYIDTRSKVCCQRQNTEESFPIVDGKNECCHLTPYNKAEQSCSNGRLFPIANGEVCQGKTYSPTFGSCCRAEVDNETPSVSSIQGCCGSDSFLSADQMCCENTLHNRRPGLVEDCCGSEMIDTATQLCWGGHIITKPSPSHMCCGGNTYDTIHQVCCEGQVSNITNGQCCGNYAFDPANKTCCSGRLQDGGGLDEKCCGQALLSDNELCVTRGYGSPRKTTKQQPDHDAWCISGPNTFTINSAKQVCVEGQAPAYRNPEEAVCGGRLYDARDFICCTGTVHQMDVNGIVQECCGSDSYNPPTQTCTASVVINKEPGKEKCGRFYSYNPETHVCFHNACVRSKEQIVLYPELCGDLGFCSQEERWYHPDEKQCCAGINKLYGPGETCCSNQIIPTPGTELGEGACCNGHAYNPNTHMCCRQELHNINQNEGLACCGDRVYNPSERREICCDENLWTSNGDNTVCKGGVAHEPGDVLCGNRTMNVQHEICCQDMLYSNEEGNQCCGNRVYDSSDPTLLCCANSTLHQDAQDKECCRDQVIDPTVSSCCVQGGHQYGYSKANAERHCCADGTYDDTEGTCCKGVLHFGISNGTCCGMEVVRNPDTQVCCGGTVKTKENSEQICCGNIMIDGRKNLCCGGTLLNRLHDYKKCCNQVEFSSYDAICDNGTILSHSPPTTTEAPTEVPETTEHSLPPPGLVQLPSLCGNTEYNMTTSTCCDEQILSKLSGHRKCCNDVIYDIRNATCSRSGKVRRIKTGTPCGIYGDGEITNQFVCCNSTFQRIKKGRDHCCGNTTFKPSKQECCSGEVIELSEAKCCGGGKIGLDESCCEGKSFKKGKDVCCQGEVFGLHEVKNHDLTHCCPAGDILDKKSGRCIKKVCKICDVRHREKYWRKQVCRKQFLFWATFSSYERNNGKLIFEASKIIRLRLDRNMAQWDEQKDIKVAVAKECKCHWIPRKLRSLKKKKGIEEKDFLIMTDNAVGAKGRLMLSDDDFIVERDPEMMGKVFERIVRKCDEQG